MKIIPPGQPAPSKGRAVPAYDMARKAMIEKQLSRYINLSCGHHSTWEIDEKYSFGRPNKNKTFCETCGKWSNIMKREAPRVYPQEPLF